MRAGDEARHPAAGDEHGAENEVDRRYGAVDVRRVRHQPADVALDHVADVAEPEGIDDDDRDVAAEPDADDASAHPTPQPEHHASPALLLFWADYHGQT